MRRRALTATALAAAMFASVPAADAAPPYCVAVTDGGGTLASTCAVGATCVLYGGVLPSSPAGFVYCVRWP